MLKSATIGIAFVIVGLSTTLFGGLQEDLEARRAAFESELAEKAEPKLLLYATELEKLEREFVSQKDYASAIVVRDEAKRIRRQLSELASKAGGDPEGTKSSGLVFDAKSATTSLSVNFDAESSSLSGWRTTEDFARWQLPDVEPGGYEVIIEYVAGSSEGGEIMVSEAFFTLKGKIDGDQNEIVKKNLGTLKIRSGNGILSVQPNSVSIGGLMRLKSIELVPAWR